MTQENLTQKPCPCGSGNVYGACCEPYHAGAAAPSPEALMRSRYSAFYLGLVDYLLITALEENTAKARADIQSSMDSMQWLALHVISAQSPTQGSRAWVEFVAFYQASGKVQQLHEKSWFKHQDGRWLYVDGEIRPDIKWGRNDPCWCGSGKKFKKCHFHSDV